MKSRDEIHSYLESNYRNLINPEFLFSKDTNQDPAEKFDNSPLRVLIVFLTTGKIRVISTTFPTLESIIHRATGNRAFVDVCYFPEDGNWEHFKNNNIPFIFGQIAHAPIRDYDLVFLSHAIVPEVFNIPLLFSKSDIPLTFEGRMKDPNLPLILYGGSCASEMGIVFGPIDYKGESGSSLVDVGYFGVGEHALFHAIKEMYEQRIDPKEDKSKFLEWLKTGCSFREHFYHPLAYKYQWDTDTMKILSVEKVDPLAPDRVQFSRIPHNEFETFDRKSFHLSGDCAQDVDIQISFGCSGAGTCSFCTEGSTGGGWRENSLERVVQDMDKIILSSAPSNVSFMSYNCNYFQRFFDLMTEGAKRFSRLSLINMRADVLSTDPSYLALAKKLDLMRVGVAVEGVGSRLRNKLFNKNLSREQLLRAAKDTFNGRFITLKMGLILSGQETEEDVDDCISEVDAILKLREESGAGTHIRFNLTPLVLYHQTPLRWMPRITAMNSFHSLKLMDKFVDAMRERNVQTKFHGRGVGTYIEQLMLDGGRALTQWLIEVVLDEGFNYIKFFTDPMKEATLRVLNKYGIRHDFFVRERSVDETFWMDVVEFTSPKLFEIWKQQHLAQDFSMEMCLKTTAHPKGKCIDCGSCGPEEKKHTVSRSLVDEHSLDQVIDSLSENRHADTTRIIVRSNFDLYHKESLSTFVTSRILQANPSLAPLFYKVGKNTMTWSARFSAIAWATGLFAFDLCWKEQVSLSELQDTIERANASMEVAQIERVYDGFKSMPIDGKHLNTYLIRCDSIPLSRLQDKVATTDWMLRLPKKTLGSILTTYTQDSHFLADSIFAIQHGSQLYVVMTLPAEYNAYLALSSLLDFSYRKLVAESTMVTLEAGIPLDVDCTCGKPLYYSIFRNRTMSMCQSCASKAMLKQFVR